MNQNSRVLEKGYNRITQTYAQHSGWSKGVDVVRSNASGTSADVGNITVHSDGCVVKVIDYIKGHELDKEGFGYGNYVVVQHFENPKLFTLYAHLSSVKTKVSTFLKAGDVIGKMGDTGNSYGAHLHFEIRAYNSDKVKSIDINNTDIFEWLNPEPYLNADLPKTLVTVCPEDYTKSTVPNRFKVFKNGVQKAAYTRWFYAKKYCSQINGYIIDGNNGKVIYGKES